MTKHDKNEKTGESEMKKKVLSLMLAGAMVLSMAACGSQNTDQGAANDTSAKAEQSDSSEAAKENSDSEELESTQITVFAAASLENALNEVIKKYNETQPNVTIIPSYDSSGTLLAQIEEGAACDVFFSAAQKQMDTLQNDDQLVVDGTRHNVVNNQVVVITYKGSGTAVTGLENLKDAKSIAMADGSVPVGKYTRQAMVNGGMLDAVDDVSTIPTDVISQVSDVNLLYSSVTTMLLKLMKSGCSQDEKNHCLLWHRKYLPLESALVLPCQWTLQIRNK